jgi:cell division protein FtsB
MGQRAVSFILILLLLVLQGQLWLGRGSLPAVHRLASDLETQQQHNLQTRQVNEQLVAEVRDLQEGLDMVEEKARRELGMVKPNEILVQISK